MADFGAPVAQNVNVQPTQTLSNILGIQQQKQQLQIGSQQLQQQQVETQKQQQLGAERQRIVQMMSSGRDDQGNSILGADGSPDPSKVIPALGRIAPLSGQQVAQGIIKTQVDKVGLQESSRALDANHRNAIQGFVQSVATGSDPADASAAIDNYVQQHPEAAATAGYAKTFIPRIAQAPPERRAHMADSFSSLMQPGQPVQTQPTGGNVDSGSVISQGTFAPPVAGGGFTPATQIQKTLAPGETPAVAGARASAVEAGSGGAARDVERANQVSGAQKNASALLPLTHEVDRLTDAISSGSLQKGVTETLRKLGFSSVAEARTQLQKDLGLLKGPLASQAGSDQRAAEILEGYPTDTTPANTTHAAMDYIRGTFRQTLARGELLKKNGQNGFAAADDAFTRATDPLVLEGASLKKGQPNGFYKRNFGSPQEAQEFKNKVDALKKHTTFLGEPGGE